MSKISVNNNNYYSPLEVDEDQEDDIVVNAQGESVNKRLPPVVVKNISRERITTMMSLLNVKCYTTKFMSIGIKVCIESTNERDAFVNYLTKQCVNFFSYAERDKRPQKYVLSGLDLYNSDDVLKELRNNNLPCTLVKVINIKNKRFDNQTNYLVFFEKGSITFADLKKCKALFNTIISWSYWRRKPNSVTQCFRCQMFGHGESHCHVAVKCANCSGAHLTANCSAPVAVKCANCGEPHKSTDPTCTKRVEFVNIMSHVKLRSRGKASPNYVINSSNNNFPLINNNSVPVNNNSSNTNKFNYTNNLSYSEAARQNISYRNNNNRDVFTPLELVQITKELLTNLRNAHSKEDQIVAIATIVSKYVYNG